MDTEPIARLTGVSKSFPGVVALDDVDLSPDRQVSHLDTLISQGSTVIAAWTLDPHALAGVYTRAHAARIPVIGFNSTGPGVTSTVWWEVNTCEPGGPHERTAAWIAARKPGAKIAVFGGRPVETIMTNGACFTAAATAAGLTVLSRTDNVKDTAVGAATLAADELTKHPDVEAFWAYNDDSALSISAALRSANRPVYSAPASDGVMVLGSNADHCGPRRPDDRDVGTEPAGHRLRTRQGYEGRPRRSRHPAGTDRRRVDDVDAGERRRVRVAGAATVRPRRPPPRRAMPRRHVRRSERFDGAAQVAR